MLKLIFLFAVILAIAGTVMAAPEPKPEANPYWGYGSYGGYGGYGGWGREGGGWGGYGGYGWGRR